jgi:hypothetical protein
MAGAHGKPIRPPRTLAATRLRATREQLRDGFQAASRANASRRLLTLALQKCAPAEEG